MKIEELRIGNWVRVGQILTFVDKIDDANNSGVGVVGNLLHNDIEDIKPIPLTEEWLLKFGLEKGEKVWVNDYDVYTPFKFTGNWANKDVYYELRICGSSYGLCSPFELHRCHKYENKSALIWGASPFKETFVHQFQNLIFALTGEELICKE